MGRNGLSRLLEIRVFEEMQGLTEFFQVNVGVLAGPLRPLIGDTDDRYIKRHIADAANEITLAGHGYDETGMLVANGLSGFLSSSYCGDAIGVPSQ